MSPDIVRYIWRIIILLLVQTILINSLSVNRWIDPQIYILAFIDFPIFFSSHFLLLIAIFVGLMMDMLLGTLGIHALACLVTAYIRPFVLRLLKPKDGYDSLEYPNLKSHGWPWYFTFCMIQLFAFHFSLFFVEKYSLQGFFGTFFRAITCSLIAVIVVMMFKFFRQTKSIKDDRF